MSILPRSSNFNNIRRFTRTLLGRLYGGVVACALGLIVAGSSPSTADAQKPLVVTAASMQGQSCDYTWNYCWDWVQLNLRNNTAGSLTPQLISYDCKSYMRYYNDPDDGYLPLGCLQAISGSAPPGAAGTAMIRIAINDNMAYQDTIVAVIEGSSLTPPDTAVIAINLSAGTATLLRPAMPTVTPKTGTATIPSAAWRTETFTIANGGNASTTYSLSPNCGAFGANGCTVSPGAITIAGFSSGAATVTYFAPPANAASQAIRLTATATSSSVLTDVGTITTTTVDQIAPTITYSPGGPLTSYSRGFSINFCDADGTLSGPAVTLNGLAVSPSAYYTVSTPGCSTATRADFSSAPLHGGANNISASINDGVHTTTTPWTVTYDETADETPVVSAPAGTKHVAPGQAYTDVFIVRNPGGLTVTYGLVVDLGDPESSVVSLNSTPPASVTLAAGQSASISINYSSANFANASGLKLTASYFTASQRTISTSATEIITVDPTYIPLVNPKNGSATVGARAGGSQIFPVWNTGSASAVFTLAVDCGSWTCSPSTTSVSVGAQSLATVSVSYVAGAPGSSTTMRVTATAPPSGGVAHSDAGMIVLTAADIQPPTLSVTPSNGGATVPVTTHLVTGTLDACDADGVLTAPVVNLAGMIVSPASTTQPVVSGCWTASHGAYSLVMRPGHNGLIATIGDGTHTSEVDVDFLYDEAWDLQPVVTSQRVAASVPISATVVDTFYVRNPGWQTATYSLQGYCSAASPASCSGSPSTTSITIAAGQTVPVTVTYVTTSMLGKAQSIVLAATYTSVLHTSVSATATVTATTAALRPPTVSLTPAGGTVLTSPTVTLIANWCDADDAIVTRSVTWAGQPLADTFTATSVAGCAYSGTSAWTVTMTSLQQVLSATAVDQAGHSITASSSVSFSPPATSVYPAVSAAAAQKTVLRGIASAVTFTVRNTGTYPGAYQLAATCNGLTSCPLSETTTSILAPGASELVTVSFTSPTARGAAVPIVLTATYSGSNATSVSATGSTTLLTPNADPRFAPQSPETQVVEPAVSSLVNFQLGSVGGAGAFGVRCLTTGWLTGCDVNDGPRFSVDAGGDLVGVWVSPGVPLSIGHAGMANGTVTVIAEVRDEAGTVLVADTATAQLALAYHTPAISPHSTSISVGSATTRNETFTISNLGNAAVSYNLSANCGAFSANGCVLSTPSVSVAPGTSTPVTVTYSLPSKNAQSSTVWITARNAVANTSIVESDSSGLHVITADLIAPTVVINPLEGQVITSRAVNSTIAVCDVDGEVVAPTITVNGAAITPTYSAATVGGCATAGSAAFNFAAQPGTNTIIATTNDGVHTTTLTRTFIYDETVEHAAVLAPTAPSIELLPNITARDTFTVRNPGTLPATYALAITCGSAVLSCTPSQTSVAVAAGQTVKVWASYQTGPTSGIAAVNLSATLTGVTGRTSTSSASNNVVVDALPPSVVLSPNGSATVTSFPTLVAQWCDPDGSLATHVVKIDGVVLADAFAPAAQPGCTTAGTSTWPSLPLSLGAHSISATATDVVGHTTTTTTTITLVLPALSDFQPRVLPHSSAMNVVSTLTTTRAFAVQNAGMSNATYHIAAICPTLTCQVDRQTLALSPGAIDSVHVTFVPTAAIGGATQLAVSATYSDIVGRSIADTASVTATTVSLASQSIPLVTTSPPIEVGNPGLVGAYFFTITNTGSLPATYDLTLDQTGGFGFPFGGGVYDSETIDPSNTVTLAGGQSIYVYQFLRSPASAGSTGRLTLMATYHAADSSQAASSAAIQLVTRALQHAVSITPSVTAPLTLTVNTNVSYHEVTFTLINSGSLSETVTYQSTCFGFAQNCRTSSGPSSSGFSLGAGGSATVTIGYDVAGDPNQPSSIQLQAQETSTGGQATGQIGLIAGTPTTAVASVSPAHLSGTPAANTDQSVTFTATNVGGVTSAFSYSYTCTGTVTLCTSAQGSSGTLGSLAPSASASVTVAYHVGAGGTDGAVVFTASPVGAVAATGIDSVTVAGGSGIRVNAHGVNPGTTIARDQCLTISAGAAAAYECGDLRIVHPLPTTTTMNKARTPVLIYSSQHATAHGVIAADIKVAPGVNVSTLRATLTITDSSRGTRTDTSRTITWSPAWNGDSARRIGVAFDGTTLALSRSAPAGAFRYTLEVKSTDDTTQVARDTGTVVVIDRSSSAFGAGWWLDGLEQLSFITPDSSQRLWVGGDGNARLYKRQSPTIWTVDPMMDRPDTLEKVGNNYRRHLAGNAYVEFDFAGRHIHTVNAQQHITTFTRDVGTGLLTEIDLPTASGPSAYHFAYDGIWAGMPLLSAMAAPGNRNVTVGFDAGTNHLNRVAGPDTTGVGFQYQATTAVLRSRTDRRHFVTTFAFDEVGHLQSATLAMAGTGPVSALTSTFCAAESASLAACSSAVALSSNTRTFYDGPRTNVQDTLSFTVNPFGAAVIVVDAIGRTTRVSRSPLLPLLVTRVEGPGGTIDSVEYDPARALPLRTIKLVDAGRYAVTRMVWNSVWQRPDSIVSPEGEVTGFEYDAHGNLAAQTAGVLAPRRATFGYDALNRVATVLDPNAAAPTRVYYDATLGNMDSTASPLGTVSHVDRDPIGRAVVTRTPLDRSNHFTRVESVLDSMDRAVWVMTTGPRAGVGDNDTTIYGPDIDSLVVHSVFDEEGNLKSLTRHIRPNPNGLNDLTTSWTYDAAQRKLTETASDGQVERYTYEDGVNATRVDTRRPGVGIQSTFDALNRLSTRALSGTAVSDVIGGLGALSVPADTETFDYDEFGNVAHATNSSARVTREYNIGGTLRRELQQVATADGSFGLHDYELLYTYDLENRRLTFTKPIQGFAHTTDLGAQLTYRYNEYGELQRVSTGDIEAFNYFYDSRGRLDSLVYPNGVREQRSYDDDGRLRSLSHLAPSATLGWQTDGRIPSDTIQRAFLDYDASGRVITADQYDGLTIRNGYSPLGPLQWFARRNLTGLGAALAPDVETYTADPLGNVQNSFFQATGFSGGVHAYDPTSGRVLRIAQVNSNPSDFNQTSWYDEAGNQWRLARSSILPDWTGAVGFNITDAITAYDALGRQREFLERPRAGSEVLLYPEENHVTESTRYDALGRRVWKHTTHLDGQSPAMCASRCYTQRFAWDGDQLIEEFRFPDSLAETDTALIYTVHTTGTEIIPPPSTWNEYSWLWGAVIYTHGLGIDAPLGVYRSGAGRDSTLTPVSMYPHHDWRGNATAVSFEQGRPLYANSTYFSPALPTDKNSLLTAYGARTSGGRQVTTWVGSLLTGQEDASGLQYRRNRYYDPRSGRFTQEDPIGLAGGANLYGFAGGDPVNFSDPFGLCPKDAGGDGKTEGYGDCPKGSSGYYANESASGRGGFVNDVKGAVASCKESAPCQVVAGVGAVVTGGIIASEAAAAFETAGATGEITGFTEHGLNRVIQRGVKPGDILNAVREGESITKIDNLGRVSYRFVGEKATVVLNQAGKVITAYMRGW